MALRGNRASDPSPILQGQDQGLGTRRSSSSPWSLDRTQLGLQYPGCCPSSGCRARACRMGQPQGPAGQTVGAAQGRERNRAQVHRAFGALQPLGEAGPDARPEAAGEAHVGLKPDLPRGAGGRRGLGGIENSAPETRIQKPESARDNTTRNPRSSSKSSGRPRSREAQRASPAPPFQEPPRTTRPPSASGSLRPSSGR